MKPQPFVFEDVGQLCAALRYCWSTVTSDDPGRWTPSRPSFGQCAVTALIVQDVFGGELRRCHCTFQDDVGAVSHYFNQLPDGRLIDLTADQFPPGTQFGVHELRTRQYVLSFPGTMERYGRLLMALGQLILQYRLNMERIC